MFVLLSKAFFSFGEPFTGSLSEMLGMSQLERSSRAHVLTLCVCRAHMCVCVCVCVYISRKLVVRNLLCSSKSLACCLNKYELKERKYFVHVCVCMRKCVYAVHISARVCVWLGKPYRIISADTISCLQRPPWSVLSLDWGRWLHGVPTLFSSKPQLCVAKTPKINIVLFSVNASISPAHLLL